MPGARRRTHPVAKKKGGWTPDEDGLLVRSVWLCPSHARTRASAFAGLQGSDVARRPSLGGAGGASSTDAIVAPSSTHQQPTNKQARRARRPGQLVRHRAQAQRGDRPLRGGGPHRQAVPRGERGAASGGGGGSTGATSREEAASERSIRRPATLSSSSPKKPPPTTTNKKQTNKQNSATTTTSARTSAATPGRAPRRPRSSPRTAARATAGRTSRGSCPGARRTPSRTTGTPRGGAGP